MDEVTIKLRVLKSFWIDNDKRSPDEMVELPNKLVKMWKHEPASKGSD